MQTKNSQETTPLKTEQDPNALNTNPQRVLRFKGFSNFRDIGGYPAAGGNQVKWGVLYRSAHLSNKKSADWQRFKSLDIQTVIDFRSDLERDKDPNRLPDSMQIKTRALPISDPYVASWAEDLRAAIRNKNFQYFDPNQRMVEWYRALVVDNANQYQRFIHAILVARGTPILWHCTSGKDRTGLAAAILLRLLGVQQDLVIKDYLLSAKYADKRRRLILLLRLLRGKEAAQVVSALMSVQKEWIAAAFQSIDENWGSFEKFSVEALELNREKINQLRRHLLVATTYSSSQ